MLNNPDPSSFQQPFWTGDSASLRRGEQALKEALDHIGRPLFMVSTDHGTAISHAGGIIWGRSHGPQDGEIPLIGFAPPMSPRQLGDASFRQDLGLTYAYIVGAMANGITSVEMLAAAGRAGMVGFFGAGGLSLEQIKAAIDRLQSFPEQFSYGFNLIHSPNDMQLEAETVALYLQKGIRLVSASAFLGLTLPLVHYRVKGIHQAPDGAIVCPNHVVAKVSRMEVAKKFFAPPPQNLLTQLVQQGKISDREAQLAQHIPMAQDISAEADSGGHTDNRPALALLPTILAMRDEAVKQNAYSMPLRVGLGGGVATPEAVCAAFSMGAAYVLTGSINQAAVEADTSQAVKQMLVEALQADVTMAPSADMFELGAKVQVLKRGTMFAMRAAKLYELYRGYDNYDAIPASIRTTIERDMLRSSFETAWQSTREYFAVRDPVQIQRAEQDQRHKMALVFRSYLGQASLWAKTGLADRRIDYQVWCGPAMGAFNAWVRGSCLEAVESRRIRPMAMNLLYGATRLMRIQWLRSQGVSLSTEVTRFQPLPVEEIEKRLAPMPGAG
jgi:trans-AT polyketide synthase/acyltransferase/oxidoreductase domain-containing protein